MNYTINGKNYIANEGYAFEHKEKGGIFKKLRLTRNDSIDNYNVIPEPVITEEEIDDTSSDNI